MKIDINQPTPYPFNLFPNNVIPSGNLPYIPNFVNPQQKALEDRIAFLEKQLAEKNDFVDMDKKNYLRQKEDVNCSELNMMVLHSS